MASLASLSGRWTVEDFFEIDFGTDRKAELDRGAIRIIAGGTARHSRVSGNTLVALHNRRQPGCSAYTWGMGVRTNEFSLRYPDVSMYCGRDGPENDNLRAFDDPKLIVEVLSEWSRQHDLTIKLSEYQSLPSLATILYIDPDVERVRQFKRKGHKWSDDWVPVGANIEVPELEMSVPQAEFFERV